MAACSSGPTAASMSIQAELSSGRLPAVSVDVSTTAPPPAPPVEELIPPSWAACEKVSNSSAGLSPYCAEVSFGRTCSCADGIALYCCCCCCTNEVEEPEDAGETLLLEDFVFERERAAAAAAAAIFFRRCCVDEAKC